MASSLAAIACSICLEHYNDTNCRPRSLPCAHKFCSSCLQTCVEQNNKACSICRRAFTATIVDDIPIDTDLEKVIQFYSLMVVNAARTINVSGNDDDEDDFSAGQCPKHKNSLLYFKCQSHDVYICRECTVIEHSPSKCNIIETKEEVLKEKQDTLNEVQLSIARFKSATSSLESTVAEKNKNISSMKAKVEALLKMIGDENKACEIVQRRANENKNITKQLKQSIESLQRSNTKKQINKECSEVRMKIAGLRKILEELNPKQTTEHFSKILLKDPKCASKIMKEENINVFAIDGENSIRYSKLIPLNDTLQFNSLEKIFKPTPNATLIPVTSLLSSIIGGQPVVYLDLEAGGKHLGRVRILITCGPKRKEQMVRLCIGQGGNTFKGSNFSSANFVGANKESVYCQKYRTSNGNNINKLIVQDLETDACKRYVEGAVIGWSGDIDFCICTRTDTSDTTTAPKLGHVVSGLEMLKQALQQYTIEKWSFTRDASQIKITEAGVELIT